MRLFEGFPYLATKMHPVRHLLPLPALQEDELVALAREQVRWNGLPAALVVGPRRVLWLGEGVEVWTEEPPRGGLQVDYPIGTVAFETDEDLRRRRHELSAFCAPYKNGGWIHGEPERHWRAATEEELAERGGLAGPENAGLEPCPACRELRGWRLAGPNRRQIHRVHCACENVNRCARCHARLEEARLDAYSSVSGTVLFYGGFLALGHRCRRVEEE